MSNNPSVVVITPTTGAPEVLDAIESIKNQTYQNIKHHVVCDGETAIENWYQLSEKNWPTWGDIFPDNFEITDLQTNTGKIGGNFYGHRIFAGFAHLVNEDYVFFLDQDNWYEPDHVSSLVKILEENKNLHFAFSLRNIYNPDKIFLCQDNCENLGKWPVWTSFGYKEHYHIDTSAYAFRRNFLIQVASLWHQQYGGDRIFLQGIRQHFGDKCYDTNGNYTLNYRLGGNENSASPDFFIKGNGEMKNLYGSGGFYPWQKINRI